MCLKLIRIAAERTKKRINFKRPLTIQEGDYILTALFGSEVTIKIIGPVYLDDEGETYVVSIYSFCYTWSDGMTVVQENQSILHSALEDGVQEILRNVSKAYLTDKFKG